MKNQRGVVYLEMLIGFLPVFMFFLGTLQVADLSVAHLVVEHAATTAARAAVVVLPDDGAYYEDEDNGAVNEFRDYRQSDVERAADTILAANPRLDLGAANVALEKPQYEERELLKAQVSAPYRCLVPIFCPGGVTITADAQLVYQGAHYIYEPSTGWASSAANRGLDNIKNKVSDYRDKKKQEGDQDKPKDGDDETAKPDDDTTKPDDDTTKADDDTTKPDDDTTKPDDDTTKPDDDTTKPDDDTTKPDDENKAKPGDDKPKPDVDDDPTNDAANQKKVDDLKKALPPKLRGVPIKIDPSLPGSTVRVHYTHDDKGRITGIEVHAGPDAKPRHIQDHVPTIKAMQRYQGVAGRARALVDRFKSWLTGNPNAGPGTLAWETKREVEKLTGIIENRAKQLEDPNLTPAQRRELENELKNYEKQLADYEKTLGEITNDPGRGFVAAHGRDSGSNLPEDVRNRLANDLTPEEIDHVAGELGAPLVSKLGGPNGLSPSEIKKLADQVAAARDSGIQGVDDWVKFETGPQHPPDHARDAALELDEALRIKQAHPNLIVNVGTDENAPIRPNSVSPKFPNGERMASFDIEVTDPATGEVRHVEVTRANPNRRGTTGITRPDELTSAVRHATDKLRSREQDGSPIQGTKEVSIEVNFQSGELPGKKGSREVHDGQGGYTVYPSPHVDKEIKKNILDDFQRDLPKIGGTDKLDVVRLTDPNGNVVAEFKRDPNTNTWTRVTP